MDIKNTCMAAKECKYKLALLSTNQKNQCLLTVADYLEKDASDIIAANAIDMKNGEEKGLNQGLLDRLKLTEDRIKGMADGIRQVASLADPIGEVADMKKRPNGLLIGQKTVPLGVVGVIYEARPNVTADVFALCFKTSNAVILKGGSDAINSNKAIVASIKNAIASLDLPVDAITLIEDTSHETTTEMMKLNGIIDVLIPRGSARLISTVVREATIPVIETGTGNCHVYVDKDADINMAIDIIINAKTQRIGVCNACESLVIHKDIKEELLPKLAKALTEKNVEIRADKEAMALMNGAIEATEEDFGTEFLDYILSVKTVSSIDEAIAHINRYNTGHSESIITKDYDNAQKFLNEIDAAFAQLSFFESEWMVFT